MSGSITATILKDLIRGHVEGYVYELGTGNLVMRVTATGSRVHLLMADGKEHLIRNTTRIIRTPGGHRDTLSCNVNDNSIDLCQQFDVIVFEDDQPKRIVGAKA